MSPLVAGDRQAVWAAALTYALLMCLTLWMWRGATLDSGHIAKERFAHKVAEAHIAIQQRLLAYELVMRGAVALFASSREVTRDEWRAYVRTLEIEKNFVGIQGIGFAERVPAAQLAEHTRKIRSEGFPAYSVRPAGTRSEYAPVVYIEPFDWRNLRVFGYDMLADPALRQTLESAADTGLPRVSGKVKLEHETADGVQHGFVMCLPVFRSGAAIPTLGERRASLSGHVCSTFRMVDLMQGILGPDTLPNIRLKIFDGASAIPAGLMYDSLDGADETRPTSSFAVDQAFEFDGHRWTLHFDSLPAFDASVEVQKGRFILVGGALISALVAAVVWSLLLNRRRAQELAHANSGLQTEIAERTKLEGELERAKDVAEAANEAKSDFLANVSHELRTPLTMILAPVEQLLAAQRPPPGWRTQLDRVQRNALVLMNRVNDILDFSKAEAGKFELCWEVVDLAEVIGPLAEDAAALAKQKDCVLTWRVDAALGCVCLDPRLLERIAMNLLSNAIKFTPADGRIELEARALEDAGFELSVSDTGIGIAADKLPVLFGRFSQVDHAATRRYGGTGIGLALVKELAQLMGGVAGVESELGRGSRFFVRLPRGEDKRTSLAKADIQVAPPATAAEAALRRLRLQEGNAIAQASPGAEGTPQPQRCARPKVMVVDDSPDILNYMTELLQDECDVVSATDGELAWGLLQSRPVDAVVSDLMMPHLDGLGLTARIKASASFSHVPVILLTARGGSDASVTGLESGADDYISKPFSPAELKARVRAVLRMSQLQADLRSKSRQAGMAEIANNVLHNVGNVLNSVTVSAGLVSSAVRDSKVLGLGKAVELLNQHAADLGDFLTRNEKGRMLPEYLESLVGALMEEQQAAVSELDALAKSVDHIKDIVATQQAYAGSVSVTQAVQVEDLIEDALRITADGTAPDQMTVVRDFAEVPVLPLDKPRLLQILVNLIDNAKRAMDSTSDRSHLMALRVDVVDERLRIRVEDNGEGIAPENLARLFSHGFSTRKNGHGFGLHSCALAARQMGGTLTAHSDGPGLGATFTLELPTR